MKKIILTILIVAFIPATLSLKGQSTTGSDKYSILTEPFSKRPVSMHMGQLQLNTGYSFSIRTKSYDPDGEKIGLKEDGSASVIHSYRFNLRYGILEFLEAGAEMNWFKQGIRGKTINYISGPDYISVNELTEFKGFEDLRLWLTLSLPFAIDNFDLAVENGISVPTARHEPDEPAHTYQPLGGLSALINYHYNNNNGTGVPVWNTSACLRLTANKVTLFASGAIFSPMKEGSSIRWNETLVNEKFIYNQESYTYMPPARIDIYASLHYQATGWLDLYCGLNSSSESGGWTEQYGIKYANPENGLIYLQPGLEIQVSPLVRLSEVAGFAVSGHAVDAPFFILTSFSFNMMPFTR